MAYSIRDVASKAGVSSATVSRVMNRSGYVSESTRNKVLKVIEELNYSPNTIAANLSNSQSRTIGMIVPDISNIFFAEVFSGACKIAEQNGYRMILCNTEDSFKMESDAISDMLSYRVCGLIMTPISDAYGVNVKIAQKAQNFGIPIVFVDREMPEVHCDGVFIDNIRGAYEATSLLIQEGHRKIVVLAGPTDTIPGRERLAGYKLAMEEHGLKVDESLIIHSNFKVEDSYIQVRAMLSSDLSPTAFFACNNLMTVGCLQAIHSLDKQVPKDYALVGFDTLKVLDLMGYHLTTVSRATYEMGRHAVRLLLDRLQAEREYPPQRIILRTEMIVRGSEKFLNKD